nr:hypothetical protein CFP56_22076 [Quercus suber]
MFPSLSTLHASACELVNLNPPLAFVNFTSLQYLDLSANRFNHEIPNWFSNLTTSLLMFDLSLNSLRGGLYNAGLMQVRLHKRVHSMHAQLIMGGLPV